MPEIVDTTTPEQRQEIAADPAKTDETIVLPVEGGAAVLDSDKDADNAGGQTAREERRKLRESQRTEGEAVAAPTNDADAQAKITTVEPATIQAGITEEGQKLEAAPAFVMPGTTNVENNTVNNTVTNNTVNNTVTNNTVTNNVTNVVVEQQIDNRTVLSVDDQIIIRNDDRPRLRRDSEESFYEELPRGRVRETIVRPGGARLVTVYDRYGDVIQRSRIDRDGEEYLMVYAPEPEMDQPPRIRDIGYDLPPMRLRIPVRDYIIDTSSDPDRDYYDFLAEPPVEQVERVYSIDEVKYSARIRDKVRRIDLDTITFASGSAEVPLAQAKTLRKVATAISEVLEKDQGETFLIEGHTDAVGTDQPNLVLSDQRAESVAELLTEVYGIPPENLVTQGYGERYPEGEDAGWRAAEPPRHHSSCHGSCSPGCPGELSRQRPERTGRRSDPAAFLCLGETGDLLDEIGDGRGVVKIEDRQMAVGDGVIGGDGCDMRICRGERLAIVCVKPAGFDLGDRLALVAFDQDEIAGRETRKDFLEAWLGRRRAVRA